VTFAENEYGDCLQRGSTAGTAAIRAIVNAR
jgi:hypothetical protein